MLACGDPGNGLYRLRKLVNGQTAGRLADYDWIYKDQLTDLVL